MPVAVRAHPAPTPPRATVLEPSHAHSTPDAPNPSPAPAPPPLTSPLACRRVTCAGLEHLARAGRRRSSRSCSRRGRCRRARCPTTPSGASSARRTCRRAAGRRAASSTQGGASASAGGGSSTRSSSATSRVSSRRTPTRRGCGCAAKLPPQRNNGRGSHIRAPRSAARPRC